MDQTQNSGQTELKRPVAVSGGVERTSSGLDETFPDSSRQWVIGGKVDSIMADMASRTMTVEETLDALSPLLQNADLPEVTAALIKALRTSDPVPFKSDAVRAGVFTALQGQIAVPRVSRVFVEELESHSRNEKACLAVAEVFNRAGPISAQDIVDRLFVIINRPTCSDTVLKALNPVFGISPEGGLVDKVISKERKRIQHRQDSYERPLSLYKALALTAFAPGQEGNFNVQGTAGKALRFLKQVAMSELPDYDSTHNGKYMFARFAGTIASAVGGAMGAAFLLGSASFLSVVGGGLLAVWGFLKFSKKPLGALVVKMGSDSAAETAVQALLSIESPRITDIMWNIVESPHACLSAQALASDSLPAVQGSTDISLLKRAFRSNYPEMRQQALKSLSALDDDGAHRLVRKAAGDKDKSIRAMAELMVVNSSRDFDELERNVQEGSRENMTKALTRISELEGIRARTILDNATDSPVSDTRTLAYRLIEQREKRLGKGK